jgi:hypothetical protein
VAEMMHDDARRSMVAEIPEVYTNGFSFEATHIPYKGVGWDASGQTEACVSLFMNNPHGLILEVAPMGNAKVFAKDYNCIRAKEGLEFL